MTTVYPTNIPLEEKNSDKLSAIIVKLSKGKIPYTTAKEIVKELDVSIRYEVCVLQDEVSAREFLRLTTTKHLVKPSGVKRFSTESGTIVSGHVKLGQQEIVLSDEKTLDKNCSVKELPCGVLGSFVVIKTRQVFNFKEIKNSYSEMHTDHVLGIYVK